MRNYSAILPVFLFLIIILGLVKLCSTQGTLQLAPYCPVGTNHKCICVETKCYLFVKTSLPWKDAQTTCAKFGGNLLRLASEPERLFLRRNIAQDISNWVEFWVGGRRLQHPWRWAYKSEPLASAYVGCYETVSAYYYSDSSPVYLTTNRPNICVSACQQYSGDFVQYRFAALAENECTCMTGLEGISELPDSYCTIVCPGDPTAFCGGYATFSVYDITKSSYMLWSETQVNDPVAHDCVYVQKPVVEGLEMRWQTTKCTARHRFVCEYPAVTKNGSRQLNISAELRTWYEARLACQQNGGFLTEPKNASDYQKLLVVITDFGQYWLGLSRSSVGWTADGSATGAKDAECLSFKDKAVYAWKQCSSPLQYICQISGDIVKNPPIINAREPAPLPKYLLPNIFAPAAVQPIPQTPTVFDPFIPMTAFISNALPPSIQQQYSLPPAYSQLPPPPPITNPTSQPASIWDPSNIAMYTDAPGQRQQILPGGPWKPFSNSQNTGFIATLPTAVYKPLQPNRNNVPSLPRYIPVTQSPKIIPTMFTTPVPSPKDIPLFQSFLPPRLYSQIIAAPTKPPPPPTTDPPDVPDRSPLPWLEPKLHILSPQPPTKVIQQTTENVQKIISRIRDIVSQLDSTTTASSNVVVNLPKVTARSTVPSLRKIGSNGIRTSGKPTFVNLNVAKAPTAVLPRPKTTAFNTQLPPTLVTNDNKLNPQQTSLRVPTPGQNATVKTLLPIQSVFKLEPRPIRPSGYRIGSIPVPQLTSIVVASSTPVTGNLTESSHNRNTIDIFANNLTISDIPPNIASLLPLALKNEILAVMTGQVKRGLQPVIPRYLHAKVVAAIREGIGKSAGRVDSRQLPGPVLVNIPASASNPFQNSVLRDHSGRVSDQMTGQSSPYVPGRIPSGDGAIIRQTGVITTEETVTSTTHISNMVETTAITSGWTGPLPIFLGVGLGIPLLLIVAIIAMIATKKRCLDFRWVFKRKQNCRIEYWADNISQPHSITGSIVDYGPFRSPALYKTDFVREKNDLNVHGLSICPLHTNPVNIASNVLTGAYDPRAQRHDQRRPMRGQDSAMTDPMSLHISRQQKPTNGPKIPPRLPQGDENNNSRTRINLKNSPTRGVRQHQQQRAPLRHDPIGESSTDEPYNDLSPQSRPAPLTIRQPSVGHGILDQLARRGLITPNAQNNIRGVGDVINSHASANKTETETDELSKNKVFIRMSGSTDVDSLKREPPDCFKIRRPKIAPKPECPLQRQENPVST